MSQASFQKQQRERARKEKAALKAARKEERRAEAGTDEDAPTSESEQAKVLEVAGCAARPVRGRRHDVRGLRGRPRRADGQAQRLNI